MATILAVYNSEGCVGRCDANCYMGTGSRCTCICGGKNHGSGLSKAIANNLERVGLTKDDLQQFAAAHQMPSEQLVVLDRVNLPARAANRAAKRMIAVRASGQLELEL